MIFGACNNLLHCALWIAHETLIIALRKFLCQFLANDTKFQVVGSCNARIIKTVEYQWNIEKFHRDENFIQNVHASIVVHWKNKGWFITMAIVLKKIWSETACDYIFTDWNSNKACKVIKKANAFYVDLGNGLEGTTHTKWGSHLGSKLFDT